MSSKRIPEDEVEIEDEEDDDEEGVSEVEFLANFLQTEEGETITQVLDKLSKHLENQNKILIKILSTLVAQKTS